MEATFHHQQSLNLFPFREFWEKQFLPSHVTPNTLAFQQHHQHQMPHCWTRVSTAAAKTSQKGWSTGRGGSDVAAQTQRETPVTCQVIKV